LPENYVDLQSVGLLKNKLISVSVG